MLKNDTLWGRADWRMANIDIPPKYKGARLEDFNQRLQALIGKSVCVVGPSGVGKTHLLCALALRQIALTLAVPGSIDTVFARLISVPNLLAKLKAAFGKRYEPENDNDESEEGIFNLYSQSQWLYLDDFGAEQQSDWSLLMLYRLIDYRWNYDLPTVVATNTRLETIAGGYSQRIASRIMGMCELVEIDGVDRR